MMTSDYRSNVARMHSVAKVADSISNTPCAPAAGMRPRALQRTTSDLSARNRKGRDSDIGDISEALMDWRRALTL